jgi:hypothetical protein
MYDLLHIISYMEWIMKPGSASAFLLMETLPPNPPSRRIPLVGISDSEVGEVRRAPEMKNEVVAESRAVPVASDVKLGLLRHLWLTTIEEDVGAAVDNGMIVR